MSLTPAIHAMLVQWAGPDFTWYGAPFSTARPTNTADKPLRDGLFAWLWEQAGGVCAFCGEANLYRGAAVCHVVSAGAKRNGYSKGGGSVAWGCHGCNELDRVRGAVVAYSTIVRPDLIPGAWPDRDVLIGYGLEVKAMRGAKPWPVEPKPRGLAMMEAVVDSKRKRP